MIANRKCQTRFQSNRDRTSALKGRNTIAPGAALGIGPSFAPQALKGRNKNPDRYSALTGLHSSLRSPTQGCALGYRIAPFQG